MAADVLPRNWELAFPGYTFKKQGHSYTGPCPLCQSEAGRQNFVVWPDTGRYWCRDNPDKHQGSMATLLAAWNKLEPDELAAYRRAHERARDEPPAYEPFGWSVLDLFEPVPPLIRQWLVDRYAVSVETQARFRLRWGIPERQRLDPVNMRVIVPLPTPDGRAVQGMKARLGLAPERVPYNKKYHKGKKYREGGSHAPDAAGTVPPEKWIQSAGAGANLFGWIEPGQPLIFAGEGEFKALGCISVQRPAATGTAGANTFHADWVERIAVASAVYLIFDNDRAGRDGMLVAYRVLREHAPDLPVYPVRWPEGTPEGYDLSDLLVGALDGAAQLDALCAAAHLLQQPAAPRRRRRRLHRADQAHPAPAPDSTMPVIRDDLINRILDYLDDAKENPDPPILLIAPPPGSGKTTGLVGSLEALSKRVFYAGPRKDLWYTLQDASVQAATIHFDDPSVSRAAEWVNLRPRSGADQFGPQNCTYFDQAQTAERQRRNVMELLCRRNGPCRLWGMCGYSQQFSEAHESMLVYGRHQHVTRSSMLSGFDVLILDEDSRSAFIEEVILATADLALPKRALGEAQALTFVLRTLLAESGDETMRGPQIITRMHEIVAHLYPDRTLAQLLAAISEGDPILFDEPYLRDPEEVHRLGIRWFPDVYRVLRHELALWDRFHDQGQAGDWNSRLWVRGSHLYLTLVHLPPTGHMPVIIADATGSAALYTRLLGRRVIEYRPVPPQHAEVVQVVDRLNHKTSLADATGRTWIETAAMIRTLAQAEPHTLIITFKELVERTRALDLPATVEIAHYGGVVGTNAYQTLRQVILAGAPMPPRESLEQLAQALFWTDPLPIRLGDDQWIDVQRPYLGQAASYPVLQHRDPRVTLLLDQTREAQMIQAFERIRTLLAGPGEKRVVLLSNLPLPGVTVSRLVTIADVIGQRQTSKYDEMKTFLESQVQLQPTISFTVIRDAFTARGWSQATIIKYRDQAITDLGWEVYAGPPQHGGRTKLIRPQETV